MHLPFHSIPRVVPLNLVFSWVLSGVNQASGFLWRLEWAVRRGKQRDPLAQFRHPKASCCHVVVLLHSVNLTKLPHSMAAGFLQREPSYRRGRSFQNRSQNWNPMTFALFCLFKMSRPVSIQGQETTQNSGELEAEPIGDTFETFHAWHLVGLSVRSLASYCVRTSYIAIIIWDVFLFSAITPSIAFISLFSSQAC